MHCIVCGNTKSAYIFSTHDRMFDVRAVFRVKKCPRCHLVFVDPQPSKETLKKHYPSSSYYSYVSDASDDAVSFFGKLRNFLVLHSKNFSLRTFLLSLFVRVPAIPKFRKDGKIMDIGCGTGHTLFLLKQLGWNVYGLDIDKKAIAIAHKKGLRDVSFGSYEDLNKFDDRTFDIIRMYHVIEHLDNPRACIRLCHKKLKKNGELIIGTPNVDSLIARIGGQYWYNLDIPRHLFLFSTSTLSPLLNEEHFQQVKLEFSSGGGIVGTVQYFLKDTFGFSMDLINTIWIGILFYPLEWVLDKMRLGDVFVITAKKGNT